VLGKDLPRNPVLTSLMDGDGGAVDALEGPPGAEDAPLNLRHVS